VHPGSLITSTNLEAIVRQNLKGRIIGPRKNLKNLRKFERDFIVGCSIVKKAIQEAHLGLHQQTMNNILVE
jgi:hypothetical protein